MVTIPCWPVVLRANFNFLPQHVTRIIHALTRREARWRVGELVGWLASSSWLVGQLRACSRACLLARLVGWWLVAWLVGWLALTGISPPTHTHCVYQTPTRARTTTHTLVVQCANWATKKPCRGQQKEEEEEAKRNKKTVRRLLIYFCACFV